VLAVALLVLARIFGKRLAGEVASVDIVVGVTVGTIAGSTSINDKVPLWAGLLALLVWGLFEWASVLAASRVAGLETLLSGRRTTLVVRGSIRSRALRRVMLSENALRSMLRSCRVKDLAEVEEASLEPSGKLSVILMPRSGSS
jgi:uncharacterized membrane protein YcaP (DUF421 family)